MSEENKTNETKSEEARLKKCIFIISAILILIILCGAILNKCISSQGGNQPSEAGLLNRAATNNDIIVDSELDLSSLGQKFLITPQVDIDNLVVNVTFYDDNRNVLTTKDKTLGNVKKGLQVSFTISIIDLGLSTSLNGSLYSISVIGGTVSYFA